MADFVDYFEATTGALGRVLGDEDGYVDGDDSDDSASPPDERDAVLCLVDARHTMFGRSTSSAAGAAAGLSDGEPTVPADTDGSSPVATPFAQAMRAIRVLCRSKVLSSDTDLLGLALYNTAREENACGLAGVYVAHPLAALDVACMHVAGDLEVAGLTTTPTPHTPAYDGFRMRIGHREAGLPPALGEALEVAQHTFAQLRASAAKHRRIFVFTDDLDPSRGDDALLQRWVRQLEAMRQGGITVELFALWAEAADGSHARAEGPGSARDDPVRPHSFWERLLPDRPAAPPRGWAGETLGGRALATVGTPRLTDDVVQEVMWRVHPQRLVANATLRVGVRADGGAVPRIAVSVFTPIMKVMGPKAERVSAATHALLRRQTQLVRRTALVGVEAGERPASPVGAAGPTEAMGGLGPAEEALALSAEDVRCGLRMGDTALPFTRAERAEVARVAAAGAAPGFTILCFKAVADALPFEHALGRSSFLHANLRQGGEGSLRAFVQLTRTMRRQGKVAIAQRVRRQGAAPRLVALVPSPPPLPGACAPSLQFPTDSLPVEGMGLYVVPLPYADDLRPLPRPSPAAGRVVGPEVDSTGGEASAVVSAEARQLAGEVIAALRVPYDIAAVGNPSVQWQYRTLERLAAGPMEGAAPEAEPFEDATQPDRVGMAPYAGLFKAFREAVLGPGYDAHALCPQPRSAFGGAAADRRRPREEGCAGAAAEVSTEVLISRATEADAWHRLTVPQLRECLQMLRVPGVAGRRKEELVRLARAAAAGVGAEE